MNVQKITLGTEESRGVRKARSESIIINGDAKLSSFDSNCMRKKI